MKKLLLIWITIVLVCVACGQPSGSFKSNPIKVGLLLPETINDPVWGSKGYKGLLKIQSELNADVYYKENIKTRDAVKQALAEFDDQGVTLVFGHGSEYGLFFKEFHSLYPHIEFIYFNGEFVADNVTSIKFNSYAMGFFGGMVAAKMSGTKKLGIIAAFDWQPEVRGFIEGANFEDPTITITVDYTKSWSNDEKALEIYKRMENKGADVYYPAGDTFNMVLVEQIKEDGLYAIGFVSDQSDLGETTVLTSTVQHVDELYELIASEFIAGKLEHVPKSFDFAEGVITLGEFSPEVPQDYQTKIEKAVDIYIKTGKLPNEYE
ncbi:BMP family ABC transporter substrate-binding protein [Calidifontibacillus oryziterrae]|uniref:BMP family ABC transporter substrate-binding protein n=1 Tax=Calidifontibacillus oryziterrae TaxID=1191699 RepID=UPI0002E842AC|nr:BMP family ABC transporter substrate-binding protein [Calidifontibacillus oryziterrae]